MLNGEVVFQAERPFADHRAWLPVDAVAANQVNRLTISAAGAARAAARVRILATPMDRPRRGSSARRLRNVSAD